MPLRPTRHTLAIGETRAPRTCLRHRIVLVGGPEPALPRMPPLLALPPLLSAPPLPPLLSAPPLPPLLSAPPLLVLRCCWCCAAAPLPLPRGSPLAGNALTAQRKPTARGIAWTAGLPLQPGAGANAGFATACGPSCRTRVPDRMLGCHRALTSARTRLAVANDGGGSGTGEDDTVGRVADQPEGSFEPVANPGRSNAGVPAVRRRCVRVRWPTGLSGTEVSAPRRRRAGARRRVVRRRRGRWCGPGGCGPPGGRCVAPGRW